MQKSYTLAYIHRFDFHIHSSCYILSNCDHSHMSELFINPCSGVASSSTGLPTVRDGLMYQDEILVSGSLQSLIEQLAPTFSKFPDKKFIFTFILTSRLFVEPYQVLHMVRDLSSGQVVNLDADHAKKLCTNMLSLIKEWTEQFPYDFKDDRMMTLLKSYTQVCVKIESQCCTSVSHIFQNLLHRLTLLENFENFMSRVKPILAEKLLCAVKVSDITDTCSSPLVVAQQLTHIELERLYNIGPEEFVQVFVKENPNSSSSLREKKTRNLESYIKWFNRLSNLVASEVCCHLKKKHRVKVIEHFIETAKECFNIGNFNSLMAIIGGLNLGPVTRLKRTWAKVNKSKLEILEHQMDPSSNFTSYRSTLKAAIWRYDGAVEDREKIIIPFFTLLVKDLHFVNEGCSNKLSNNHINFEKCWQLSRQLEKFNMWKQAICPFEKQTEVINYLLNHPLYVDNALLLASFECEHPENNFEKERFKLLKRVE